MMFYTPVISRYDGLGVSSGAAWTGVARIHDWRFSGTGVLLESGLHLLTAAHLVDALTLANSTVEFHTQNGSASRQILKMEKYPGAYLDDQGVWHDLALITLKQAAPLTAERYSLFTGNDEVGRITTLVGYGQPQSPLGVVLTETVATRRAGDNTIDALGTSLARFNFQGSLAGQLFYDYDNGTPSRDALGNILGLQNRGLGSIESMITPGDSGGGLFVEEDGDWLLAGINSYVLNWPATDINAEADGSIGDIGVATRVSSYQAWIEEHTGQSQIPVANTGSPPSSADVPRQVLEGQGVWFLTQLPNPATQVATVEFSTRDGSATAGQDYISTHGTISIGLGQQWVKVWVQTLADSLLEGNETFSLVLTNPQGANFPAGQQELSAQRTILDDVTLVGITQLTLELFA